MDAVHALEIAAVILLDDQELRKIRQQLEIRDPGPPLPVGAELVSEKRAQQLVRFRLSVVLDVLSGTQRSLRALTTRPLVMRYDAPVAYLRLSVLAI